MQCMFLWNYKPFESLTGNICYVHSYIMFSESIFSPFQGFSLTSFARVHLRRLLRTVSCNTGNLAIVNMKVFRSVTIFDAQIQFAHCIKVFYNLG